MRDLYNYITASPADATVISTDNFKKDPLSLSGEVYECVQELAESRVKDAILKGLRDWYKDNQSRRNISAGTSIQAKFYVVDPSDKLLVSVVEELKRIGVYGSNGEWDYDGKWGFGGVDCGHCNVLLNVATYKQLGTDNYKFTISNGTFSPFFNKITYGNGYNDLPAEDMNILRQKLYDCMNGTKVEIKSLPGDKRNLNIPGFIVALTAQYDKKKLKDLLDYLKNNKRLQNFATRMEATSRGIAAYYASKRPGDYTGD